MKTFDQELLISLEGLLETPNTRVFAQQHNNGTYPVVKIRHEPTGLEVICDDYESFERNKALGLIRLAGKVKKATKPPVDMLYFHIPLVVLLISGIFYWIRYMAMGNAKTEMDLVFSLISIVSFLIILKLKHNLEKKYNRIQ